MALKSVLLNNGNRLDFFFLEISIEIFITETGTSYEPAATKAENRLACQTKMDGRTEAEQSGSVGLWFP